MNKTEQETRFLEKTIKFRPHIAYTFFDPVNRPRRLLKGWHLFPFHPVYRVYQKVRSILMVVIQDLIWNKKFLILFFRIRPRFRVTRT